ncbi:hypothetical protein GCM10007939_09280 [Amylibacter marinus]|uniref:Heme NO-binding domain-containing protein n=1 Tax=Amylibacter marinus TaxID=1475483 RepID=A0ABQ5VTP5_9RHOB|nr:heme NO-binding domain-containing protein [Amylibacter marinus]GLQ34645.1 hypothetical protein GCM10007939_09280 [Amylibacter marinus]
MVNRGLQCFVVSIYGSEVWHEVCADADLPFQNFETVLPYDEFYSELILDSISQIVQRKRDEILEDFGTFLVSEHCSPSVRRLLRLGGVNYVGFLHSLEDVYDRASIAIPDLDMPLMQVDRKAADEFIVKYEFEKQGYGAVFLGLLRAMADDYGALVTVTHQPRVQGGIDRDIFRIHIFNDAGLNSQPSAA